MEIQAQSRCRTPAYHAIGAAAFQKGGVMSASTLKLIVVAAMVAQHVAIGFLPSDLLVYSILLNICRLTAPIMCFFVAEGYYHTSNLKSTWPGCCLRCALWQPITKPTETQVFGFC